MTDFSSSDMISPTQNREYSLRKKQALSVDPPTPSGQFGHSLLAHFLNDPSR